ncbi:hypothetical protein [Gorillibacterium massiliense]|uniref:hypothetical protein n=1 Tax=Gorillibacterium massiliense TaxID=1280390 RepID=UPI0004B276F8|nr:hypothetical protein [Gorillibacterium massiliense]
MSTSQTSATFIIVAFCFAAVLILSKDRIPGKIRRYLAMMAMVMVIFSFVLIVISLLTASTS